MAEKQEAKGQKPEGKLAIVPILNIKSNKYRPSEVFVYNEEKIAGLKESMISEGFWTNVELIVDKWGVYSIAGGGHHRNEAAKQLIQEGLVETANDGEGIRGIFKNDKGEWCAKFVVKKYTKEQQLKMFMLENADAWNKDAQQNVCMMTIQVKDYLDQKVQAAADVEDFIESVNSPYPLKMDARSFTRAKNAGIGATTIVQFLGENTWSRPAIQMAIETMTAPGPEGAKLKELAEKLPSVVMAYKFKHLMTTENEDGEKILSAESDQEKAEKIIEREALSRADLEKADKLKKEADMTPLAALNAVVDQKKDEKKKAASADKAGTTTEAPSKATVKPAEKALEGLKAARGLLREMVAKEDSWSVAQGKQATDLFKEMAGIMKKLTTAKNKKK